MFFVLDINYKTGYASLIFLIPSTVVQVILSLDCPSIFSNLRTPKSVIKIFVLFRNGDRYSLRHLNCERVGQVREIRKLMNVGQNKTPFFAIVFHLPILEIGHSPLDRTLDMHSHSSGVITLWPKH